MGRTKYSSLALSSLFLLGGCASFNNSEEVKDGIFKAAYIDRTVNGKTAPPDEALNNGQQSRLNVYARKTCRFASPELQTALKSGGVDPEAGVIGGYIINKAAELGVSSLITVLKAAGEDRLEETPISTSLTFSQNENPVCIELSKNSEKSGRFIVELGINHSTTPGVFRIVPLYLNYNRKSKSYLLNGGKRTIALKLAFAEIGAEESSEIIINLGDWREGDIAYFNHGVTSAENMNMASSWLKLTNHNGVPLNLNAVFMETTSGNKIAKILAAEIEENEETVTSFIQNSLNPEDEIESDEVKKFRDAWEPKVCTPGYGFADKIKQGTKINITEFSDLARIVNETQDQYRGKLPADLKNDESKYMDSNMFNRQDFYAPDGQLLASTTLKTNADKLTVKLDQICRTRSDG